MDYKSRIYVAGHNGLVGSSIIRELKKNNYDNIYVCDRIQLNLLNQNDTYKFFEKYKPEYVFLAAARVGGIIDNNINPAEFIYENLQIQCNILNASYLYGVKKLLFLGSSCIYPKYSKQPIVETELLQGQLEPTNSAYAMAKLAGITMCQSYNKQYGTNFISVMPTNLYGQNDNYDINTSHVLPALIRKISDAKENNIDHITIFGDGTPKREFMYVDDLADACLFLMKNYNNSEIINIGTGIEVSILDLVNIIKSVVDYNGDVIFDISKPNGMKRKLLNISKLSSLGWQHKTNLYDGIVKTYEYYKLGNVRKM